MDRWELKLSRERRPATPYYLLSYGQIRLGLIPVAERCGQEWTGETHFTVEVRSTCCSERFLKSVKGLHCRRCRRVSPYGRREVDKLGFWERQSTATPNLTAALEQFFNPVEALWHEHTVSLILERMRLMHHSWMERGPLQRWAARFQFRSLLREVNQSSPLSGAP